MNLRQGQDATGRPVSGRWFEQLPVGTHVQHVTRRTVTETDNVLFTTMTINPAPMHLDAEYAGRSEFGRPLVTSMFTAALVVGLSVAELTLGTPSRSRPRAGLVVFEHRAFNQRDEPVCRLRRAGLMHADPAGS
jgi:acyl dehydratase